MGTTKSAILLFHADQFYFNYPFYLQIVYPDMQRDIQNEIMLKMLQMYERDEKLLSDLSFKDSVNGK